MSKYSGNKLNRIILLSLLTLCWTICLSGCNNSDNQTHTPQINESNQHSDSTIYDNRLEDSFRYSNGTIINGVDISGLTFEEARLSLIELEKQLINEYTCDLYLNDMHFTLGGNNITITSNLDELLLQAKDGNGEYSLFAKPADDYKLDNELNKISQAVSTAPKSESLSIAIYDILSSERFKIVSGKEGRELDMLSVKRLIMSGEQSIELIMLEISPAPQKIVLPVLRGSCETEYSIWNEGRAHNVEKAAGILNGMVLKPNDELSFDTILGPRNKENGWKKAEAFTNGGLDSEEQYGGGICQVSSTLYNAALKSDLIIPLRCNHSKPVPYIAPGLDAAISEGSLDLIIRNSTLSDIYIFMWTDKGKLHCEIYGEEFKNEFDRIDLVSEYVSSIPPSDPEFHEDYQLAYGETLMISPAVEGSIYESFKVYYDGNTVIKRIRIGESRYRSHPAIYSIGMHR